MMKLFQDSEYDDDLCVLVPGAIGKGCAAAAQGEQVPQPLGKSNLGCRIPGTNCTENVVDFAEQRSNHVISALTSRAATTTRRLARAASRGGSSRGDAPHDRRVSSLCKDQPTMGPSISSLLSELCIFRTDVEENRCFDKCRHGAMIGPIFEA
eukprot:469249-Rhodomonas_salina.4